MNPIVHFEIPVDDVEWAKQFYTGIFGWEIKQFDMRAAGSTQGEPYYLVRTTKTDENHMVKTPGAINGGMMKRKDPNQPFMNYISVEDIDQTLEQVTANGGKVCMLTTEIAPGMGWIAAFQDSEGNLIGLHQTAQN